MTIADIFAALVALIHVYIFCLESLLWGRAKTNRAFGVTPEIAEHNRQFAFNQGFYNLFLTVAVFAGFMLRERVLVDYACLSVLGAGLVLWASARRLWRPALIQAGPALVYLVLRVLA